MVGKQVLGWVQGGVACAISVGGGWGPVSNLGPTFQVPAGSIFAVFGIYLWRKTGGTLDGAHATPTKASLLAPPLTDTPNV